MSEHVNFGKPYQLRDAAGNIVWLGAAFVCNPLLVTSAEASAAFAAGEAAKVDVTNSIIPRWDYAGTDDPPEGIVKVLRCAGGTIGTELNWPGVALQPIAAGKSGVIAGSGSITCVKVTATTIAVGLPITSSATVGAMGTTAFAQGNKLGICIKTNTVAAPGTGTTAMAGVLISPE